jgi:hypothetical protein
MIPVFTMNYIYKEIPETGSMDSNRVRPDCKQKRYGQQPSPLGFLSLNVGQMVYSKQTCEKGFTDTYI